MRAVSPGQAKDSVHGGGEIAFLDVREAGEFGEGHPLFAVPCPYSRLELQVAAFVPRKDVAVLLIDGGDGVAEQAARRLEALDYRNVVWIEGGAPGWQAAGFALFKGVNVPSKTLGELAETLWHPRMIDTKTLAKWQAEGRDFGFFDTRSPAEYAKMRVPGAVCLPNGELAHRFDDVMGAGEKPVVVTCAGRTRGILGAAGLTLAGVGNPVYALENGTQGWALEGFELERGNSADAFPALTPEGRAGSEARARRFAAEHDIAFIEPADLGRLAAECGRTIYRLDVRSAEEFASGHVRGAVHAPGGQLVQATDQWVGVRHARLILFDDTGMRGALAAFWLRQLGYEPYVLTRIGRSEIRAAADEVFAGARSHDVSPPALPALAVVTPHQAFAAIEAGDGQLLDLRSSRAYRLARPKGAAWAIRPRLPEAPAAPAGRVLLLVDDPRVAALAAIDLEEQGLGDVAVVEGGMAAWRDAGLPVATGDAAPSDWEAIDFLGFVHDRHDGNLESSRRYLAWEKGLVGQLDAAERDEFRLPASAGRVDYLKGATSDPRVAGESGNT